MNMIIVIIKSYEGDTFVGVGEEVNEALDKAISSSANNRASIDDISWQHTEFYSAEPLTEYYKVESHPRVVSV